MYISPSGKKYIGQTINEKSRKNHHKTETSKGKTYFAKAIQKYGFENLKYEVLIKFKPTIFREKLKRILDKLEVRYIKMYKSDEPNFGYNLNKGGNGNLGYKHTEEELERMSIIGKERIIDPEKKEILMNNLSKGWLTGPMPESTKQKLSESNKNKKAIEQYDLEMNLINTFISIGDAARSIKTDATIKTKSNRISECVSSKRKTAYNYIWIKCK